jgi:hypothetical protein
MWDKNLRGSKSCPAFSLLGHAIPANCMSIELKNSQKFPRSLTQISGCASPKYCSALELTTSRWMRRAPKNPEPAKRWHAFLRNHRKAIAAMDFFTVPTIMFGMLLCHRPRPPEDPTSECHKTSDEHVDRAAVATGVSVRIDSAIPLLRS